MVHEFKIGEIPTIRNKLMEYNLSLYQFLTREGFTSVQYRYDPNDYSVIYQLDHKEYLMMILKYG